MTSPAAVYLAKWPKTRDTHKTMHAALFLIVQAFARTDRWIASQRTVETFPWHELRYDTARAIPALLADTIGKTGRPLSVPTINKSLVALRGVLESAWRSGQIPDEDYRRIDVKNVRGSSPVAGRALSPEEMDAVHAALPATDMQEAAMIALLCATGIRRVELVRLSREDFDQKANRLTARGKGNKARTIPIAPRWLPFIGAWWERLSPKALAFTEFDSKAPMSRRTVSYIVEAFCADARLPRFTPHDLRRSFATRVCENADIAIAAKLLGHSSVNTSALYDRRGVEAEDEAVKGL